MSVSYTHLSPARKLQLAEFAIANLYVDEVNEGKLVEEAIGRLLAGGL